MSNIQIHFLRLFVLIMAVAPSVLAQSGYKLEFGVATGASNYLGEIGGREKAARPFLVDMKVSKTRWDETGYIRYRFHPQLIFKAALNYVRIEGDDKLS